MTLSIAHVYNYMHPHYGGPPNVIVHLLQEQLTRGYTLFLMASDLDDPEVQRTLPFHPNLHLVLIRPRWIRSLLSQPKIDRVLKQVDLVHFHSIWPTPCLTISARCRALQCPYLLSVHGHLRPEALALKKWKKKVGLALGYANFIHGAAAVHALNPSEKQDALQFGLRQPIHIIPNGISPKKYPIKDLIESRDPLLEKTWSILKDKPYILFLSRLHHRKGVFDLLHAFAQIHSLFPKHILVLAGGDHGCIDEVQELIMHLNLTESVLLTGFVFGKEKDQLLRHADLFTLPSEHEGFSIAILEALGYGLPTLISSGCHFEELGQSQMGWIHPLGIDGLKEGLLDILNDHQLSRERGINAQKWVFKHYSWKTISGKYNQLYQDLRR